MADDQVSRLSGLMTDARPVFEEVADTCEAAAKNMNALLVLMSAEVDADKMVPHLQTGMKVFLRMRELGARLQVIVDKHNA